MHVLTVFWLHSNILEVAQVINTTMHTMLIDKKVKNEKTWLQNLNPRIKKHSELCHVVADPTRVKILLLLNKHNKLCVSDLANIVGVSISAISHQLDLLERSRLVSSIRMGRIVCYYPRLDDKTFVQILRVTLGNL